MKPAEPVVPALPAPVASLHLYHLLDRCYRDLAEDFPQTDVLRRMCCLIADALSLPLVVLLRRHATDTLDVEATSRETLLWAELTRLPERCERSVVGHGPAARALAQGAPLRMSVDDEGFLPWREAARRDRITVASAWPLETEQGDYVLMMFGGAIDACTAQEPAASSQLGVVASAAARIIDAGERSARERLLSAALEHAGNAAFLADTEGSIVWSNAAFSRLSGYPREEILGRNPRFLSSGQHGVRHYHELWSHLRAGQVWRGQTVDHDRQGRPFTAMQTISPVGRGDRVTHYLAIYEDISDQKREADERGRLAGRDVLTGLMYRAALEHRATERLAQGEPLRLGLVNLRSTVALANRGPAALETLLKDVRARLASIAGADNVAALTSGDYLVLLPIEADLSRHRVQALSRELSRPAERGDPMVSFEVRIGCAAAPGDGKTLDELMLHADRAIGVDPYVPARRRLPPT